MKAFSALARSAVAQGALDGKTKELIAITVSVASRCDDCIGFHVTAAVDRGATRGNPRNAGHGDLYGRRACGDVCESRARRLRPVRGAAGGRRTTSGAMMSWNMFSRFGKGSDPDVVDFGDLEEAVGSDAWTVIDVREPHEFAAGHIPNALNMPTSTFDPKDLPQGKPVVLVCQAGGRSRNALNKARAIGREDVRHFPGGMNGWRSHNGPITL